MWTWMWMWTGCAALQGESQTRCDPNDTRGGIQAAITSHCALPVVIERHNCHGRCNRLHRFCMSKLGMLHGLAKKGGPRPDPTRPENCHIGTADLAACLVWRSERA